MKETGMWRRSKPFRYDLLSISQNVPAESGVYVILSGERCLYVGESPNLLANLLLEVWGIDLCIRQHNPTHYMFETVPAAIRKARQQELIEELRPVCNDETSLVDINMIPCGD